MPTPDEVVSALLEGNERFRAGLRPQRNYSEHDLEAIAQQQKPIAAVVACADSRVTPEIVMDQPLGQLFCARVPGNVAAESAQWMVEIAVREFQVPVVLVLGHTRCLAVTQVVQGSVYAAAGELGRTVSRAVFEAKLTNPADLMRASLEANVRQTMKELLAKNEALAKNVRDGQAKVLGGIYEMESGFVTMLKS